MLGLEVCVPVFVSVCLCQSLCLYICVSVSVSVSVYLCVDTYADSPHPPALLPKICQLLEATVGHITSFGFVTDSTH